jgi:glyoxylase I family protein
MALFHHIALTCKDPIALERFYTDYFGFSRARVVVLPGGAQIVFIKSGNTYLELFAADETSPVPPPKDDGVHYPGVRHFAFKVDDLDATLAKMGDAVKKRITLGPLEFNDYIEGWKSVWFADPEGNIVEISQGFVDDPNVKPLSTG